MCPTVWVEMYLQEYTVFDLDPGIKIPCNIAKHPLHHLRLPHPTENGVFDF